MNQISVDLRTGSAWRAPAKAPAMVEASKTEPEVSEKKRKALTREQKEKRNEREKAKREFRKKFESLLASEHSLEGYTLSSESMALFMSLRKASNVPGAECTPEQFLAVFFEESKEEVFYDQYAWLGEVGKPALYWSLHTARVAKDPMIMVEKKVVEPRRKKAKKEDHMAQHLAKLGKINGLSPEAKAVLAQMQQTYATQQAKKQARSERRKKARAEKKAAAAAATESSSEHVSESESSPNPEDDDAPKTPEQRFGDEIDGTQMM